MFSTNVHLRSIISSLEEQPWPNLHFIFKFLFVQIAAHLVVLQGRVEDAIGVQLGAGPDQVGMILVPL
jgi:hypothetical protein